MVREKSTGEQGDMHNLKIIWADRAEPRLRHFVWLGSAFHREGKEHRVHQRWAGSRCYRLDTRNALNLRSEPLEKCGAQLRLGVFRHRSSDGHGQQILAIEAQLYALQLHKT